MPPPVTRVSVSNVSVTQIGCANGANPLDGPQSSVARLRRKPAAARGCARRRPSLDVGAVHGSTRWKNGSPQRNREEARRDGWTTPQHRGVVAAVGPPAGEQRVEQAFGPAPMFESRARQHRKSVYVDLDNPDLAARTAHRACSPHQPAAVPESPHTPVMVVGHEHRARLDGIGAKTRPPRRWRSPTCRPASNPGQQAGI